MAAAHSTVVFSCKFIPIIKTYKGINIRLLGMKEYDSSLDYKRTLFKKDMLYLPFIKKLFDNETKKYFNYLYGNKLHTSEFNFRNLETYETATYLKNFSTLISEFLSCSYNLIKAIYYNINYNDDSDDIKKYIELLIFVGKIFYVIDLYLYFNYDTFDVNKLNRYLIDIIETTKLKSNRFVDISLFNNRVESTSSNIKLFKFVNNLREILTIKTRFPLDHQKLYRILDIKKINFSYQEIFNTFKKEIQYNMYIVEKLKSITYFNTYILNFNRELAISTFVKNKDYVNSQSCITVEMIMSNFNKNYKIYKNFQGKEKLLHEIKDIITDSYNGIRIENVTYLKGFNDIIYQLFLKIMNFINIYKKWNYNGNLKELPIYDKGITTDYISQLSLSETSDEIFKLKHIIDINLILQYIKLNLKVVNGKFDLIYLNNPSWFYQFNININTTEWEGRYKLHLIGEKIKSLYFNFDLYFTNPENNPFYSIRNHIYPIKDHIINLFCANNRKTEKTVLRFLPSEIWFFILGFMRLSDFNIKGRNKLE